MPRRPRLFVPGACYHVTARGNHRQPIFRRLDDRRRLDEIVEAAVEASRARIHAYCWMTNHLHLLVQVSDLPLGVLMQRIGTSFARHIQKSVPTTGHLFENRYHALLVDVDAYFLELLRYIHLNPVRAGIVSRPEAYRWSSHRVYLGRAESTWLTTDFALAMFDAEQGVARRRLAKFVDARLDSPSEPGYYAGHARDPRVIGRDSFLDGLFKQTGVKASKPSLDQIVREVCEKFGLDLDTLRRSSRVRKIVRARGFVAARACDDQIATLSEVAQFLGHSVSAMSRAKSRVAHQACRGRNAKTQT